MFGSLFGKRQGEEQNDQNSDYSVGGGGKAANTRKILFTIG